MRRYASKNSRFFEIALVPVYFDQFASRIVNVDHSIMLTASGVTVCMPSIRRAAFSESIYATLRSPLSA